MDARHRANQRYATGFNDSLTSAFSVYQSAQGGFGTADVINSSWGFTDASGTNSTTVGLDGLARANPLTTFVVSAGNSGPNANTVTGPGSGFNGITVGAYTNADANNNPNAYNVVASFSSRGPQNYFDATNHTKVGVRAAVDIAAPGADLVSAYYGGQTGGNSATLGGTANGSAGGPGFYSSGLAGTSFAAPLVAGAATLLDSTATTRHPLHLTSTPGMRVSSRRCFSTQPPKPPAGPITRRL